MKKKLEINKKINMAKLVEQYPESSMVLMKHGFHCLGCVLAQYETLEEGAKAHGMEDKEVDKLIEEIKSITSKGSKKKSE